MNFRSLTTLICATGLASASALAHSVEPPSFADIVQPHIDSGKFVGALGVVFSSQGVLAAPSAGYANLESKAPLSGNTLFWIASTTKPFQATAIMMLVDDGKVGLDDPVVKYLPEFKPRIAATAASGKVKMKKPKRPITVRMLLNHTSGLTYAPAGEMPPRVDCCPLTELVERFAALPLAFEPGTSFQYSNAGPDTASRIVEVVSGQRFEDFLSERLLWPLGMHDTTFFPNDEQLARLATSYWFDPAAGKLVVAPNEIFLTAPYGDRGIRHAPGGGLFSRGTDLALFGQMFLNKGTYGGRRYLSEAAVAEMTRNQIAPEIMSKVPQLPGPDAPMGYGLGWGVGASGAYFHTGVNMTIIRVDPARGIGAIFLAPQAGDETGLRIYLELGTVANKVFAGK
jgi:CubicO group peptidase (beta-lactamase class C family)